MTPLPRLHDSYDAVVVGARCAGAATAMLLARQGARVLVVDRGRPGSDTLSTHALMRPGVLQLRRWGVLAAVAASGAPPVRRAVFHYADASVEVPVKPRDGVEALYAPRRTVLDALLAAAAAAAGADVRHGMTVTGLVRGAGGRVAGVVVRDADGAAISIRSGIVIGADGLRSTVARLVSAAKYHVAAHTSSVVYGYWSGLDLDGYHFYYRPGVSAGAIPTNAGETCVFACVPGARFATEISADVPAGYRRVVAESDPALASRLDGAALSGPLKGFAGEPGFLRQSRGPGWALVGDAGYFRDPITAHGMSDALRDAELLARAVVDGSDRALAEYQAVRDDVARRFLDTTDAIAAFDWTLEEVQRLHRALSEEMARETALLSSLGPPASAAGGGHVSPRPVTPVEPQRPLARRSHDHGHETLHAPTASGAVIDGCQGRPT